MSRHLVLRRGLEQIMYHHADELQLFGFEKVAVIQPVIKCHDGMCQLLFPLSLKFLIHTSILECCLDNTFMKHSHYSSRSF